MEPTLEYRTPPSRRWSLLSILSLLCGFLSLPMLYVLAQWFDSLSINGGLPVTLTFFAYFILAIGGVMLGMAACFSIDASEGALRGKPMAILGTIASILWPVALGSYVMVQIIRSG